MNEMNRERLRKKIEQMKNDDMYLLAEFGKSFGEDQELLKYKNKIQSVYDCIINDLKKKHNDYLAKFKK